MAEMARKDLADALRPYLRFTREGGLQLRQGSGYLG
jgi:hypothetical protein